MFANAKFSVKLITSLHSSGNRKEMQPPRRQQRPSFERLFGFHQSYHAMTTSLENQIQLLTMHNDFSNYLTNYFYVIFINQKFPTPSKQIISSVTSAHAQKDVLTGVSTGRAQPNSTQSGAHTVMWSAAIHRSPFRYHQGLIIRPTSLLLPSSVRPTIKKQRSHPR